MEDSRGGACGERRNERVSFGKEPKIKGAPQALQGNSPQKGGKRRYWEKKSKACKRSANRAFTNFGPDFGKKIRPDKRTGKNGRERKKRGQKGWKFQTNGRKRAEGVTKGKTQKRERSNGRDENLVTARLGGATNLGGIRPIGVL